MQGQGKQSKAQPEAEPSLTAAPKPAKAPSPRQIEQELVRRLVLKFAIEQPELGQFSVAAQLRAAGLSVSPATVRKIWVANDLQTSLLRLEAKSRTAEPLNTLEQISLERAAFNAKLSSDAREREENVGDLRRELILRAASRVFARTGYSEATLGEVCAEAGIKPASLYYYFPSKEELFLTVHAMGIDQVTSAMQAAAGKESDPWRRLEETCATAMRFEVEGEEISLVVKAGPVKQFAPEIQAKVIEDRARYEDIFREQIAALPLDPRADRSFLRLTLLSAINGASVWYKPGRLSPEEIGRMLIRTIFGYGFQRLSEPSPE